MNKELVLEDVYNYCRRNLYRISLSNILSKEDKEDVIQMTVIDFNRNYDKIDLDHYKAYIQKLLLNRTLKFFRGKNGHERDNVPFESNIGSVKRVEDVYLVEDIKKLISEKKYKILLLRYQGYKFREISEIIGIATTSVYDMYKRTLELLKEYY